MNHLKINDIMSYKRNIISKKKIDTWIWVALRVAVGVILIWKGFNFTRDTLILEVLTGQNNESLFTKDEAVLMAQAVLFMLVGGSLMIFGVFTPIVSLVQLLIFSIGSLFIHAGYIERNGFELVLTGIVPFLLLMFVAKTNRRRQRKWQEH
jgi:uncharacterized membrane protein YphA (DoxX/SURF4 family)